MLTEADNERLTRVGPGTPMGNLFRRYWLPACLSEELPEPDGAPVRVRLLGEDLVAFRDIERQGRPRLRVLPAPPRADVLRPQRRVRAALRLPRLEVRPQRRLRRHAVGAAGLAVQDEGEDRRLSHLGRRRHGLGLPRAARTAAAACPATSCCARRRRTATSRRSFEDCNFLQALEGGIDPTHASIMHNMNIGDRSFLNNYDELVANIQLDKTDYGFTYAGIRSRTKDTWVRGYHWIMPSFHMRASRRRQLRQPRRRSRRSTATSGSRSTTSTPGSTASRTRHDPARPPNHDKVRARETRLGRGDFLDANYKSRVNRSNDYEIDRPSRKRRR